MRSRYSRWGLSAILVLYLGLGIVYSITTPVFEAPDESHHFFVIKHLVDHRALPVQRLEVRGAWNQEGSQPPLYYIVGALLVSGIDLSDAESLLWRNPQANIGDPASPGNKNVFIHPPEQGFPWRGTTLAVHLLRLYSLVLGAGAVATVYCIAATLVPRSPAVALCAAAVAAFIPQFLFITSSVNNDNAMTLLGSVSVYLLLGVLRGESAGLEARVLSLHRWVSLGVVLALAALAKLTALTLLPLTGVVIGLVAWHRRSWRAVWQTGLAVGLPLAAVAGWWYVRNVVLYGEPTGLSAMWEVVGRRDDFGEDLWGEFRALRYSFWGLFGWFSVSLPGWLYRILDLLSLLALLGLCIEVGRWVSLGLWRAASSALRFREPEWGAAYRPLGFVLLGLWLTVMLLSVISWTSLTPGTQGRLLFPALASCALFFVLGLRPWFIYKIRDATSLLVAASMFVLAAVTPVLWIAPVYAHAAECTSLPEGAVPLDLVFGDAIALRGVAFNQDVVYPGEAFEVELYWEALRQLGDGDDFMVVLRLIDPNGAFVGVEDAYPGAGGMPASLWRTGCLLAGHQYVAVGRDAPAPLVASLGIALNRTDDGGAISYPGDPSPVIGRAKIVPRRWPSANRGQVAAFFDSGQLADVRLVAAEWASEARAGKGLSVKLTWEVWSPPGRDYAVFVHLEDGVGNVYGYGDGAPRDGLYPTWVWAAREVIEDEHVVPVHPDVPRGYYHVVVGLYDSGGRVAAFRPGGERWANDAVDLGMVEVQ